MRTRIGTVVVMSLFMLGLLAPAQVGAASLVKIGVVDLQKALNATAEGMAAKESLRKKHQAKQEKVDAMKTELDSMGEKLKSPVLSESAQADLKKAYMKKKAELIDFVARAKAKEGKENQEMSSGILDGLVEITKEVAADKGFSLILEESRAGIIYSSKDIVDLTESIVKIYNERMPGRDAK
ncbi:MAG: OmpH family outer membrane protein [Deltaproteobacteria bacterium]|nr:OmpH family outer membrane protein [Deltaproteobacteria bacterium]